jgi:serine-type D-Ala-D-Ala carboxypeptidase (penicillin-binding protein 5/6)
VRVRAALIAWALATALASVAALDVVAGGSTLARKPTTPPATPGPTGSPSPFPSVLHTPKPGDVPPEIDGKAAVLQDLETGQVLFAVKGSARLPVASLTKIMTALLVLERTHNTDVVTVGAAAASQSGSVLGLDEGERITVRHLLYGLLLQSSNDAAVALAEHLSGSVGRFVGLMNDRARALGLRRTRFRSPNGLDDRGRSTALDVATLTRVALANPIFREIVRTRFHTIPAPSGPSRRIQNRNALLWLYPDAIGVKTGFTTPAGHCLVAAAEREGLRLLAVVLGEPTDTFSDGAALLDHGFTAFTKTGLVRMGEEVGPVDVRGRPVPGLADRDLVALVRQRDLPRIERTVTPLPGLRAPVLAGQTVGRLTLTVDDRVVGEVPVVAARGLDAPEFWEIPPEDLTPAGRSAQALAVLLRSLAASFL